MKKTQEFNKENKVPQPKAFRQYGWIVLSGGLIFIEALLILALWYNIQPRPGLLSEKCTFPVLLTCTDHKVTATGITMIILNGAGRDMNIAQVSASSDALGTGNLDYGCSTPPGPSTILSNRQAATFILKTADNVGPPTSCTFRDTGRDKNRYNINISYNWLDSIGINHQMSGELLAKKP